MSAWIARLRPLVPILGVVALIAGILFVLKTSVTSSASIRVSATFERVTGLVPHADVTVSGARIGEVAAIDPTPDGARAVLTLALEKPPDLRADAAATVHIKSLLGEMYVELEPGSAPEPLSGDIIPNTASDLSIDDILHNVAGYIGEITGNEDTVALIESIQITAELAGEDFDAILGDTRLLFGELESRAGALNSIVANLDLLTASLGDTDRGFGELIAQTAGTLGTLRSNLVTNVMVLESALATLQNTLTAIDASELDAALATIPGWLVKIDHVLDLLGQLAHGDITIAGEFAALPDVSRDADAVFRGIARIPWLREPLIREMQSILEE